MGRLLLGLLLLAGARLLSFGARLLGLGARLLHLAKPKPMRHTYRKGPYQTIG